jgi:hypothetical protein
LGIGNRRLFCFLSTKLPKAAARVSFHPAKVSSHFIAKGFEIKQDFLTIASLGNF